MKNKIHKHIYQPKKDKKMDRTRLSIVQTRTTQRGGRNQANLNIQVEGLHHLLVDHGILGSKHTGSPNPTKAGEVMSSMSLLDRYFFSSSMSVLSDN